MPCLTSPTPSASPPKSQDDAQLLLDVVDSHNVPLCRMRAQDVTGQQLPSRAVGLLVRDRQGRFLLTRQSDARWGLPALTPLPAGQSHEELATDLLRTHWRQEGRVALQGLLPPAPPTRCAFLYVYATRLATSLAAAVARVPDTQLLVTPDELHGLARHFPALLSPLWHSLLQAGFLPQPKTSTPSSDNKQP